MQECAASMTIMSIPRRETRAHSVNSGINSRMAQTTPLTDEGKQAGPMVVNLDREGVMCEKDDMDTDIPRAEPTTGNGEAPGSQDMLTDSQMDIQTTEDQAAKPESEAHGADRPETTSPQSDDGKAGKEVGCSPKRSKKMRVDKPGETTRERSRSAPRRASFKGKT